MDHGVTTELLSATEQNLERAAAALKNGELVAFPTETVYGLGANALDETAVSRVFVAKGRPSDHPLIVHLAGVEQLTDWTGARSATLARAERLAAAFWPGPLTMVLPRSELASDSITGGQDTVALRSPAHPVARALLARSGLALAAPSANRFGRISPTTAAHVFAELDGRIRFILDGGPSQVGLESTIVDLSGPLPRVLRPGAITQAELQTVLEEPVHGSPAADAPRVSGSLSSHYAPVTRTLLAERSWLRLNAGGLPAGTGVIATEAPPAGFVGSWLQLPESPSGFGRQLYAALRQLDGTVDVILVQEPPAAADWAAVTDRLRRASSGRPAVAEGQELWK